MKTSKLLLAIALLFAFPLWLIAQTNDPAFDPVTAPSPDTWLSFIPETWRGRVLFFLAISPYITRAVHSLIRGGGIKGFFSSIWLGTNTPQIKDETVNPFTPPNVTPKT